MSATCSRCRKSEEGCQCPKKYNDEAGPLFASVRASDPSTSREAWESIRESLGALHAEIGDALLAYPDGLTSSELASTLDRPRDSISPRMRWLVENKIVADSGVVRAGPSGRKQIVWRIVR